MPEIWTLKMFEVNRLDLIATAATSPVIKTKKMKIRLTIDAGNSGTAQTEEEVIFIICVLFV